MTTNGHPVVIVESPYAGDIVGNIQYLNRCLQNSILRGEVPVASHKLFPGALRDEVEEERALGIYLGFELWSFADRVAFYVDRGWSRGMIEAMEHAEKLGMRTEERRLV